MNAMTNRWGRAAATCAALALFVVLLVPIQAQAQSRLQLGSLACTGTGGWGAIITSTKAFRCTFSTTDGVVREQYDAVISKFGLDLGVTGDTSLMWLVFGPAERIGPHYVQGSLQGSYVGVGADASVGLGLGANALVGGGPSSFALQPVSVQVQTGLSIAAGVQTLDLTYAGPLNY